MILLDFLLTTHCFAVPFVMLKFALFKGSMEDLVDEILNSLKSQENMVQAGPDGNSFQPQVLVMLGGLKWDMQSMADH